MSFVKVRRLSFRSLQLRVRLEVQKLLRKKVSELPSEDPLLGRFGRSPSEYITLMEKAMARQKDRLWMALLDCTR